MIFLKWRQKQYLWGKPKRSKRPGTQLGNNGIPLVDAVAEDGANQYQLLPRPPLLHLHLHLHVFFFMIMIWRRWGIRMMIILMEFLK